MPTPRYRAIAPESNVDETLFGESTATKFKNQRRLRYGPTNANDVVISERELAMIQGAAIIRSEAQIQADKDRLAAIKAEKEKKSHERKARMRELEKKAIASTKKSDVEVAAEAKANALRAMAQEKLLDNSDAVKALKSMAARAITFSIRDQQKKEKVELDKRVEEVERRQDIIMEIDRIKDIKRREDIEKAKLIKRKEDGKVITEQIEARRRARLMEAEQREQEAQQMIAAMKKLEEMDKIKAAERAIEVEKSRKEVIEANAAFIASKKAAKEAQIKEMEDLMAYQAMKDKELADREAELAAQEAAKKERQLKLLAQQEKAQDNAGKLDELRARRAAEEYERKMRRQEMEKAAKNRADTIELLESRAKQSEDKKRIAREEAALKELEVQQGLDYMKRMDEREARDAAYKKMMSNKHRQVLHEQIEKRAADRKGSRSDTFAEGDKFRQELLREEAKLTVIRDQMVKDLIDKGVNPLYLSEMNNADIQGMLRR